MLIFLCRLSLGRNGRKRDKNQANWMRIIEVVQICCHSCDYGFHSCHYDSRSRDYDTLFSALTQCSRNYDRTIVATMRYLYNLVFSTRA